MNMFLVSRYSKNGEYSYYHQSIGEAELIEDKNSYWNIKISLSMFPVLQAGSFVKFLFKDSDNFPAMENMTRIKILLNDGGVYKNNGYGFLNFEKGKLKNINVYTDVLPFERDFEFTFKLLDPRYIK